MTSIGALLRNIPQRLRRVTSSGSYVPQIDGLRFVAIFLVIIYHSAARGLKYYEPQGAGELAVVKYLPMGQAGVELFFFISGLIIAYPFLSGKPPSLGNFYKRRLLRLEPPYMITLLLCFLALGVLGLKPEAAPQFAQQQEPLWQSFVTSIFYLNGTLYGSAPRLNPPLWSLEIEIFFYLLAPFIVGAYRRVGGFGSRVALAAVAVVAAMLVQAVVVVADFDWYYRFPTHLFCFCLGIVVSDWTSVTKDFYRERGVIWDLAGIAGLVLLVVSASLQNITDTAPVYFGVLALRAVSILALFLGAAWGPMTRRVTGAPWIALIGGACYSIYLVHVPVMNVGASIVFRIFHPTSLTGALTVGFVILSILSVIAGMIFYVLIERPCMQHNWHIALWRRLTGRRTDVAREPATSPPAAAGSGPAET